jgi:hypothetical protein
MHTGEYKVLVFLAVFMAVVVVAEGMTIEVVAGVRSWQRSRQRPWWLWNY